MEKESRVVRQLIRILNTDIPGHYRLGFGLTRIKGVGVNFSHAFCVRNNFDESKLVGDLTDVEIKDIESKLKSGRNVDSWVLNRQRDYDTGEDVHILTADIKFRGEFDVKRLQKVKAYKGMRHAAGLPVRGQRTKAHFRSGRSVGVSKMKAKAGGKAVTAK